MVIRIRTPKGFIDFLQIFKKNPSECVKIMYLISMKHKVLGEDTFYYTLKRPQEYPAAFELFMKGVVVQVY